MSPQLQSRCEEALKVGFIHHQKEIKGILKVLPEHVEDELKTARFRHYIELIPSIRFLSSDIKSLICNHMESQFFLPDTNIVYAGAQKVSAFIFVRGEAIYGPLIDQTGNKQNKEMLQRLNSTLDPMTKAMKMESMLDEDERDALFQRFSQGKIFSQEALVISDENVQVRPPPFYSSPKQIETIRNIAKLKTEQRTDARTSMHGAAFG